MQAHNLLLSPAMVFILFLFIGWLLLAAGMAISAKSEDSPGKHMHYSCGEDLETPSFELSYHVFFRLALLFGILHIIALMISTIPAGFATKLLPVLYLVSAGVSMSILLEREHE